MKLVVGLGNIGKEYENTRHNIGFMFVDRYLKYRNINDKFKEKFNAMYIETTINNEKVMFIKPMTYMNNSGLAVNAFLNFYKVSSDDILVISDDLDLDLGKFRLRSNGSSGGHNGLKNIISNLGTDKFKRLRVGISNDKEDVTNYETITSKATFGATFKSMNAYATAPLFMSVGCTLFGEDGETVDGTN